MIETIDGSTWMKIPVNPGQLTAVQLRVSEREHLLRHGRAFRLMPDTSDFDVTTPRGGAPRRGNLVAALLLGLLLVGGFIALWVAYGSAPPRQPQADVAANASNETAQVIRDLQTAIKGLQTTDEKVAGQLQSVQQTLASNQAETKRLADQVTALSGKLDALQQSFASAQRQSSPASSEPPPAPAKRRR